MPDRPDAFQRIDALVQLGLRLARTAPSGRLMLARLAETIDPAWLAPEWRTSVGEALADAARAADDPLAAKLVRTALTEAWGEMELDSLEPDPAAVRPASQVHRGVLDGRPVAVKLLRPGIAAGVRRDLALLEGLLAPLGAAFPGIDPAALMRELRTRVLDELDLETEAANMRRFQRALRSQSSVHVPAPVTRLAQDSVLVSEWMDGVPLGQAGDVDAECALLVRFVIGGLREGLVHADIDPRDVLVRDDGIAVLDFGTVAEPVPERVALAAAALDAFIADDDAGFTAAVVGLGALPADLAPVALTLIREVLGELAGPAPVRLDSAAVLALGERANAYPRELARLIAGAALPAEDLWPLRAVGQLFGTIARVGATAPWRELIASSLRDGWSGLAP